MKLFQWLRKRKGIINSVLITAFTSLFFNAISNSSEVFWDNPWRILRKVIFAADLNGVLAWLTLGMLVVFNAVYLIMHHMISKSALRDDFVEVMRNYTSDSLKESVRPGSLSWGEGKTVLVCNDIIYGWKAANVMIDSYDDNKYAFFS